MAELRTIIGSPDVADEQKAWPWQQAHSGAMYSVTAAPSGGQSYSAQNLGLT